MSNVGYATLTVIPSMRGVKQVLEREMSGPAHSAGADAGDKAASGFKSRLVPAMTKIGAAAFAGLAAAGTAVVGTGLKIAADMEQANIAFTTMLGSGEKAKVFLDQLKAFAAKTPFEFPELQKASSSLIAAGVDAAKVIPIMTTLGNVTSGMGTGAEGVQRATIALQQMSAAGKITGEDLNQLRDAGVPVFDLLAAATGKSKEAVAQLAQAGKLGKTEMDQLFKALESGKGLERFNGLMEKQSESLLGLLSSLKDNVGQSLAGMMTPVVKSLEKALPKVTDVIGKALEAIGPDLTSLATGLVTVLSSALPTIVPLLGAFAGALGDAFKLIAPAVAQLFPALARVIIALLPILPGLANAAVKLAPALVVMANAFARIIEAIPPSVLTAFVLAFVSFTQIVAPLIALVATIGQLGGVMGALAAYSPTLAAAFGALLGPIGLVILGAAALAAVVFVVIKNWEPIKGFFAGIFDWFKDHWPLLLAILTGPFGLAVKFIVDHFDQIVGFVKGLPGRIAGAAKGMFDGIKDAFRSAINWVIRAWNGLDFKLPTVDTHIPGIGKIGGFTLGTPDIPVLHAGGIFRAPPGASEGLALLADGEAVFPAAAGMQPYRGRSALDSAWSGGSSGPNLTAAQLRSVLADELDITLKVGTETLARISGRELARRHAAHAT